MWPGVTDISALGCFKKDEVISIKDSEGHLIGVGALSCSMEELKKNNDGSGVAVFILHYKGDRLWDMGDKQYPEVVLKGKEEEWEEEEEEFEEIEKVEEKQETTAGETKK